MYLQNWKNIYILPILTSVKKKKIKILTFEKLEIFTFEKKTLKILTSEKKFFLIFVFEGKVVIKSALMRPLNTHIKIYISLFVFFLFF